VQKVKPLRRSRQFAALPRPRFQRKSDCRTRKKDNEIAPSHRLLPEPIQVADTNAFADRLRELGWVDGRTIAVEYRYWEGQPERVAEVAAEFVRQ
jgi:hypothetical protein